MKGGGEKTVTQQLDPQTQKYRDEIFNRARSVSNQQYTPYTGPGVAGVNPLTNSAAQDMPRMLGQYGDVRDFLSGNLAGAAPNVSPYADAGATGAKALGGDQGAISSLMNPYQSQVIDAMHGQYDKLRNQSALDSNDAATRAGAFGGDRAALMKGARLGEVDSSEASNIANLLSGGYNDAMTRAGSAAGLATFASTRP